MAEHIVESGMSFIADNAFHIEKSPQRAGLGERIKSVEFVRVIKNELVFVEAKTSFANPHNPESKTPFDEGIAEVCEKFVHSLNLYSSIAVGVSGDGFPSGFAPQGVKSLKLVLVIANHKLEWCPAVKSELQSKLPEYIRKIWKPYVFVLDRESAFESGFIAE